MKNSKIREYFHLRAFIIIIPAFLLFSPLKSQVLQYESLDENVLKVNGTSSMDVEYDITIITLELHVVGDSQLVTLDSLGNLGDMVVRSLVEKEITSQENIKTTRFQSDQNITYDRKTMEQKIEYSGHQNLEIIADASSEFIITILNVLSTTNLPVAYHVNFNFSRDKTAVIEKELTRLAFDDAKSKAKLLAENGDFEILGIRSVNYNNRRPQYLNETIETRGNVIQKGPTFGGFQIPNQTMQKEIEIEYNIRSNE